MFQQIFANFAASFSWASSFSDFLIQKLSIRGIPMELQHCQRLWRVCRHFKHGFKCWRFKLQCSHFIIVKTITICNLLCRFLINYLLSSNRKNYLSVCRFAQPKMQTEKVVHKIEKSSGKIVGRKKWYKKNFNWIWNKLCILCTAEKLSIFHKIKYMLTLSYFKKNIRVEQEKL